MPVIPSSSSPSVASSPPSQQPVGPGGYAEATAVVPQVLAMTSQQLEKCDVYSFGYLLWELYAQQSILGKAAKPPPGMQGKSGDQLSVRV